uniref:Uncharacterized protein n=2 Tax=Caenorhabditis japonica TaxID=281687 RepID=A0A8R1IPE5_CAEJA
MPNLFQKFIIFTMKVEGKERKEKSSGLPEIAGVMLVELFIRDEKKWHNRSKAAGKNGKSPRQEALEDWQAELAAIGCDRTTEQIYCRVKGDLATVKSLLSPEKAGSDLSRKFAKLDFARSLLYEHLAGTHDANEAGGDQESSACPSEVVEEGIIVKCEVFENGIIDGNLQLKVESPGHPTVPKIEFNDDEGSSNNSEAVDFEKNEKTEFCDAIKEAQQKRKYVVNEHFEPKRTSMFSSHIDIKRAKINYWAVKERLLREKDRREKELWEIQMKTAHWNQEVAMFEARKRGLIEVDESNGTSNDLNGNDR